MVCFPTCSSVHDDASATRPPCFFAAELHALVFSMPSCRIIKGVHPRHHVFYRRRAEHHGSARAPGCDTSAVAIIFLLVVAMAATTATIFSMQAVKPATHGCSMCSPPLASNGVTRHGRLPLPRADRHTMRAIYTMAHIRHFSPDAQMPFLFYGHHMPMAHKSPCLD
jgi:hypothetical protein